MITIKVYPVDTIHGLLVWLFGRWTGRVNWQTIHWTIAVTVGDMTAEYHLTGAGVTTEPMKKSKPTRIWNIETTEVSEYIDRIEEITNMGWVCSYESMLKALFIPDTPRVDTCIGFVSYVVLGCTHVIGNYPMGFAEVLNEMYGQETGVRQGGLRISET